MRIALNASQASPAAFLYRRPRVHAFTRIIRSHATMTTGVFRVRMSISAQSINEPYCVWPLVLLDNFAHPCGIVSCSPRGLTRQRHAHSISTLPPSHTPRNHSSSHGPKSTPTPRLSSAQSASGLLQISVRQLPTAPSLAWMSPGSLSMATHPKSNQAHSLHPMTPRCAPSTTQRSSNS